MSVVEYVLLYHDDYKVIKFSFKRKTNAIEKDERIDKWIRKQIDKE